MINNGIISLFILPIIIFSCTKISNPVKSEAGPDEILYITNQKLYIYNLETGEEKFVTDQAFFRARWSPDGKWIAYNGPSIYEGSWQIYIVKPDGSGKRIVTLWERDSIIESHPDGGFNPVWSPDGKRIAFYRCINCEIMGTNSELFIVDLDTSNGIHEVRLTNNIYADLVEDWDHDMSLFYRSQLGPNDEYDLFADFYEIDINTLERKHLLECDSLSYGFDLRYSQARDKIAYIWKTRGSNSIRNEIYLMNRDGTGVTKLTDNTLQENNISWSSDGERMLFMVGSWSLGGQLYLINSDGTGLTKITSDSREYFSPDWRPHSK